MKQQLKKDKLPKILYVYSDDDVELDADERVWYCVLSEEELKDVDSQGLVGIYELKSVGTIQTSVKFTVFTKKGGQ